jgi:hypothetical protein
MAHAAPQQPTSPNWRQSNIELRQFGFLGQLRVNVPEINLAFDEVPGSAIHVRTTVSDQFLTIFSFHDRRQAREERRVRNQVLVASI